MSDMEKVIKGLECHAEVNCVECPFIFGGILMENNNSTKGFLHPLTDARIFMAEAMKREDAEAKKCEERKTDRQVGIKDAEEVLSHVLPDEKDTSGIMVKPTKCPCGELFDAKDSSFCPKCGCAYGELSGRYTNIGR